MSDNNKPITRVLDTFDHVVVLMLENRSFDNLLGYLYSRDYPVPPGAKFEGVDGKGLSNPISADWQFNDATGARVTSVPVARIAGVDLTRTSPPFPDPGEDYPHVNTQLFNTANPIPDNQPPYNLPNPIPAPTLNGFVSDYIQNYLKVEYPKQKMPTPVEFYGKYKFIMECYDPKDVSVLSSLAREFAVFDHWFCSVPSETICNRNFWHAGTSWGHVINPGPADDPGDESNTKNTESWFEDTKGETLFSQLSQKNIPWKIYSDNRIPLTDTENLSLPVTPLLHMLNFLSMLPRHLPDITNTLENFKSDCAKGTLPAYSFIEPNFFNPHNDMHPSTPGEVVDGGPQKVSSVLLGDALVWEIYNAIFTSPHHWNNTLLIITFDEHGGCYDHVTPPGQYGTNSVEPAKIATPPNLDGYTAWDGFAFDRLGLRVPTIMVSPYIKKNTIINTPLSHTSFLKSVHAKWQLASLSTREDASPNFHDTGVLSTTLQRTSIADMPKPAAPLIPPDDTDYSKAVLSALAKAIENLFVAQWCKTFPALRPTSEMKTQADVAAFLRNVIKTVKENSVTAAKTQIDHHDGAPLFRAIADGFKRLKRQ
jgi:phospholipase C